ncbi:flavodoxin family protein [Chloroflexota bacterium]
MKVLGVVCSPRKGGNTEVMMQEALAGARSYGAETELWTVAGKELKPCDACESCTKKEGKCHINDDMQELYPKILDADGIIFGSPSYFESVSAQAKIVIDRMYGLYNMFALVNKVAGVINVAHSSGHEGTYDPFCKFIKFHHMFSADQAVGFATYKGEIRKDKYAMKSSEELGKQVVALIKQQFCWPEEYRKPLYRVCEDHYGISSSPLRDLRNSQ